MTSVLAVSASAATVGSMTAWASTNTITINLPTNDKATHTYEAYQVFKGDLSSGVLSNITWGDHVDQSPLLAALVADTAFQITNTDAAAITTTSSAADVAKYLSVHNDATTAKKFADHVNASLNSTAAITGSFTAATTSTAASAVIDVTTPGYYLVKDKDNSLATTDANGAYTKFILKVVGPETVTAKEDVPSITKKIVQGSSEVSANTASIGDVIPYVLHSSVPDMTNFDSFCYVINDTMEAGLTFNDDVTINIGTDTLVNKNTLTTSEALAANPKWFEVQTGAAADGYSFQIVLNNFKQYTKDTEITVNYSATLNQKAELYTNSNDNTASLTFSNNPNYDYSGNNEPGSGAPKGITPGSKTETFTTAIKAIKVDGKTTTTKLSGAVFRLSGSGLSVVKVDSDYFKRDDTNGTYYQRKNGTYTTTEPTSSTADSYVSTTAKYVKVKDTTEQGTLQYVDTYVTSDTNGVISFKGLAPGTYTLTEITPPPTYNALSQPITITITGNATNSGWTASANIEGTNTNLTLNSDEYFEFNIANNKGVTLPGTGGVGTTIFYIIGGLMISGALVLLIVKKRMSIKEK